MLTLFLAAATATATGPVEAAVAVRSRAFEACFAKADAACLVDGYFVPDAMAPTASPPGGQAPVKGRAALIAMYEGLFKDVSAIRLETLAVASGGGIAHELGRAHLTLRAGGSATGRYTVLWRRTPAGWRAQIDFIASDGWRDP